MSKIEIKKRFDHYAVYVDDEFYCTADSYREAEDEIEQIIIDSFTNDTI